MSNLVRAVVLLDRPTVLALAQRIADEEIVARAGAATQGTKRLPLPFQFFTEQDALRSAAQQLAAAAAQGNDGLVASDSALADRFATLARTCVACHSAYLHGRIELPP
jgi:cytochrome c556